MMTHKKSLETLYSSDVDSLLCKVRWRDINDQADMWEKLFTVLTYLVLNQECLRALSGTIEVGISNISEYDEQMESELWPIIIDSNGIQSLKKLLRQARESISYVIPYMMSLRAEALVLLPTEVQEVQITAIDLGDMEWGTLKLQADNEIDVPEGFIAWWTVVDKDIPEDESVMYVEFYFELSVDERYFRLSLDSDYDIFRPIHFDSIPNDRYAVLTFERHMSYLSKLATQTGGTLEIYDNLVDFFPSTK